MKKLSLSRFYDTTGAASLAVFPNRSCFFLEFAFIVYDSDEIIFIKSVNNKARSPFLEMEQKRSPWVVNQLQRIKRLILVNGCSLLQFDDWF